MFADMKKIQVPIHNISIRSKLILYFLLVVFVPLAIVMIIMYSKSVQIIADKINYSVQDNLAISEENITSEFNQAFDFSTYIYLNDDFQNILSAQRPVDITKVQEEMESVNSIINKYYFHSTVAAKFFPKVYMLKSEDYNKFTFSSFVFSSSIIEGESWFRQMPDESEYTVVGPKKVTDSLGSINTVEIARWLYSLKSRQPAKSAVLTVDINLEDFLNILEHAKPSLNSILFIYGKDGRLIARTANIAGEQKIDFAKIDEKIAETGTPGGLFKYGGALVGYRVAQSVGWTIVSISPLNEINGELNALQRVMFIVLGVCIVLVVLLSIYLSRNISYPIRKLAKSMAAVKDGNLDVKLEYNRNDEFTPLISIYNLMIEEIKALIGKVRKIETDKKEAELKALQSQINPHFLYNTLDSVNLLAMKYKVPEISTMVTALSDFFRYSLNKGKSIITLRDEIRQVESYMIIQKIRFSDKIDFKIDVQPDILENITVKLILQPIVENAIIHGIEKRRGKGMVSIQARSAGGVIEINIVDDGVGADVDELNAILRDRSLTKKSFAIKNVDERIKQIFGEEYGIRFFNNDASGAECPGTRVLITIPAVKNWEEYHA